MRIHVDADACPDWKEIASLAETHQKKCLLYCDTAHILEGTQAKVIYCDTASQSVDLAIQNKIAKGDVVVTQDYGVALIALGKGAYALHPSGKEYLNETIDEALYRRFLNNKQRKQRIYGKGPKKRTKEMHDAFLAKLEQIILRS